MKSWGTGSDGRGSPSGRITAIMAVTTIVLAIVGIILFVYLSFTVANMLNDHFNPPPTGYDRNGQIKIDTDRLQRIDPIVAIWQSNNFVTDNWPQARTNFLLVFYDDHTYAFYDLKNSSCKTGSWAKTEDTYTDYYTLGEGTVMSRAEVASGLPAQGHFQVTLYEEGTPPNARIAYMDYNLLDYDPLKPDTISKLNDIA